MQLTLQPTNKSNIYEKRHIVRKCILTQHIFLSINHINILLISEAHYTLIKSTSKFQTIQHIDVTILMAQSTDVLQY